MVDGDTRAIIRIVNALVRGLRADALEDVGTTTVPRVVAINKTGQGRLVKFRAESGLEKERGEILRALLDAGVSRTAARAVLLLHKGAPLQPRLGHGEATTNAIKQNLIRRSQYLLNAARRLQREIDDRESGKTTQIAAIRDKLIQEQRHYRAHLLASHGREVAASRVDAAVARFGDEIGWYTTIDERTSHECLAAHGKNFSAHKQPAIGWPGSVHPRCRCQPGRPHDTDQTIYGLRGD